VKLFNDVKGFIPPTLIPLNITPSPENSCDGVAKSGSAKLSFIVDESGRARNIVFEHAIDNDADFAALRVLQLDRFKPGELNGAPVASLGAMKVHLGICAETGNGQLGNESETLRLRALPDQVFDARARLDGMITNGQFEVTLSADNDSAQAPFVPDKPDGSVTPPKLVHTVEAKFSAYARQHKLQGIGVFRLTVDEHGLPRDIAYVPSAAHSEPLDPSLVQQAILAIRQYRFKPARNNGMPVPVQIKIQIEFRL
jgi:Gram-negative bacterial TonB protein C-terminal